MDRAGKTRLFRRYFERVASKAEEEEFLDWIREQEDKDVIPLMDQAWEDFNGHGIVFTEEQSERMMASVLRTADPAPVYAMDGHESSWRRTGRVILVTVVMAAAVLVAAWALLSR